MSEPFSRVQAAALSKRLPWNWAPFETASLPEPTEEPRRVTQVRAKYTISF
jgi:hypothetical protein